MNKYFLIAGLLLLSGCIGEVEIPADVIPKEKMVSILIDVHITEGNVQQLRIARDSADLVFKYLEKDLFLKHAVSDSSYIKSLGFYFEHPDIMEEIYATVLDSLSLYDRMLQEKQEKE